LFKVALRIRIHHLKRASSEQEALPYVIMQPLEKEKWRFEFYLQNESDKLTDQITVQQDIKINRFNEKYFATIKLPGFFSNERIIERTLLLKSWIAKEKLLINEAPKIAKYKSFWDFAFIEKKEIMIEVRR